MPHPLTLRALHHPLELASAFVAREAWARGIPHEALSRSAPQRMGIRPGDAGALHVGLFLPERMVGYARCAPHPDADGDRVVHMLVLHPHFHPHHWLPEAFASHASRWTPGMPPITLPWPAGRQAGRSALLRARERIA